VPVRKSRMDIGEFHVSHGVDSEACKQAVRAARPHDVVCHDQLVGDQSTGSMESMEWRRYLHVIEEEEIVSSKQSAKLMEDVLVSCSCSAGLVTVRKCRGVSVKLRMQSRSRQVPVQEV